MRASLWALAGAGAWAGARALRSRRAVSFDGQTVVVSGGSRGLGLMLARRFAGEGARLALLARTDDDLEAAAAELRGRGAEVHIVACDVSDREDVEKAVLEVVELLGPPSVLVHDAGIIQAGPQEHMTEADYRDALGVHFWGAYYLTEAVRPHLPRDGSARIGYVSSFAGRVAVPHLGPYSMSKHALVGYADAMRAELAADGVRVTTITPGPLRTGSHVNATFKGDHEKEYAWFAAGDANPLLSMDGDRAADAVLEAVRHGDPALTLTVAAKLGAVLDGVAPGAVASLMKVADRLLPSAVGPEGDEKQTGWESFSAVAPSPITHPADKEVVPNNELRGHDPERL